MILRRFFRLLPILILLLTRSTNAQVVELAGGISSFAGTAGGAASLYGVGSTTRLSLGDAEGIRLGVSREVQVGDTRMVVGDVAKPLHLPTDGPEQQRVVYARGLLLQQESAHHELNVFLGRSGEQRGTALFSAVMPDKPLVLLESKSVVQSMSLHLLLEHGGTDAALASASRDIGQHTTVAITAGWSMHAPILRSWMHTSGDTWELTVGHSSGLLQLQPEALLRSEVAEQIGFNFNAVKRLTSHVIVDIARHEYATPLDAGVNPAATAGRALLWEAGVTLQQGSAHMGLRGLLSKQGTQRDGGLAWLANWRRPRWDVQSLVLNRIEQAASSGLQTTLQVDAGENVHRHVRLEQGFQLGSGSPRLDAGGSVEGNRGSLRVTHGETYVAVGAAPGFHRLLTVSVQLNLRNATLQVSRVSANGLSSAYEASMVDFEGSGLASGEAGRPASVRMLRYTVEGTVREQGAAGLPVAGAAVAVGPQLVYTDSDGRWMARFPGRAQVRVSLRPGQFLTEEGWSAQSVALTVSPGAEAQAIDLRVSRVLSKAGSNASEPQVELQGDGTAPFGSSRFTRIKNAFIRLLKVWH